jgi:hypothetical protein
MIAALKQESSSGMEWPMGAKAGILALGDGDFAEALTQLPTADAERTAALVADIFPGYQVEPVQGRRLAEATYPPDEEVQALSAPGIAILCDGRCVLEKPSELPRHVLDLVARCRVALCAMHSVDDSFAYAVWNDGELVRSLSVSLARGIIEDVGEPFECERPFWPARRAFVARHPGAVGFRPLDLAQRVMRWLFGFALEGRPEPDDVDAGQISMLGYRITDPAGTEQAAREAALREFLQHHRRRRYRVGPDGSLTEIDEERA